MRVLLVLAAALVLASPVGSASRRAELFVNALDTRPSALAEIDVELSLPRSAASVELDVPTGYTVLDRRPGSAIGSATVTTSRRVGAELFVEGPAVWRAGALSISVDGDKLTFSPPPGATDVDLDLRSVLVNPSTPSVLAWRAAITPVSGPAYELRSIVAVPQVLTARYTPWAIDGRLLFAGKPRPGVNVHVSAATRDDLSDERELGVATTRSDGTYTLSVAATRSRRLTLIASVNFYVAACPLPCVGESIAPPPAAITVP